MHHRESGNPGRFILLLVTSFWCWSAQAQALIHFDVPAQSLAASLKAIGIATNTGIGFNPTRVAGLTAPALKADMTLDEALTRVLAGTGLHPRYLGDRRVVIDAADQPIAPPTPQKADSPYLNQTSPTDSLMLSEKNGGQPDSTGDSSSTAHRKELDEIVVTGSHIRGVTDTASPMQTFTRDDIDRTGLGTIQAFIEKLPQNFGNASENTVAAVAGGGNIANSISGSAVNLRGLGNDATLVLINGRRVAPSGLNGNITDISLIPLSAVSRIEILTDGASAIYGADAVGGVINFILRDNYDGSETRARFGTAGDGESHESQLGQTLGKTWSGGSAILSYEYWDRTPLSAQDRGYSDTVSQPFSLLPEQVRHGVFASAREAITDRLELFSDNTFSHRSTYLDASTSGVVQRTLDDIDSFSDALGGRLDLSDQTVLEIALSYARSRTTELQLDDDTPQVRIRVASDVLSVDAKIDGRIGTMPAGEIRYAAGAQFRKESIESDDFSFAALDTSVYAKDRRVEAVFGELRVPILASTFNAAVPALEITFADRYEHYSDFSASDNPHLGVIWRPTASWKIRGTLGTSFKAPLLSDLNPIPSQVVALPVVDPRSGAASCFPFAATNTCTNSLIVLGGNSNLGPEKARTWTAGVDFQPESISGLKATLDYYNIRFTNRIVDPSGVTSYLNAFQNEITLGQSIVQRNPTAASLQALQSGPNYINPFNLSDIGAILDFRVQNLSSVQTSGLDFSGAYRFELLRGEFETGADATYILKLDNKFTAAAPALDNLNSPYNPVDLRARGRMSYRYASFDVTAFVNYVNSYRDNRLVQTVPVASWTTIDANLGYKFLVGSLAHASASVGVTNLANRAPPFVANPILPIYFDGANANALGRVFYLQLSVAM